MLGCTVDVHGRRTVEVIPSSRKAQSRVDPAGGEVGEGTGDGCVRSHLANSAEGAVSG